MMVLRVGCGGGSAGEVHHRGAAVTCRIPDTESVSVFINLQPNVVFTFGTPVVPMLSMNTLIQLIMIVGNVHENHETHGNGLNTKFSLHVTTDLVADEHRRTE